MGGKFVALISVLAGVVGLFGAGEAAADPNEDQQIHWSEQLFLLHGSYAQPPREVWSVSLGEEGLALRLSSFQRDGDIGYFQLSPAVDGTGPGALASVDLSSGAIIFQHAVPAGASCFVDQGDHVVNCGGSGSQSSAKWQVFDSRSGEVLIDQSPAGGVVSSGAEHGFAYVAMKVDDPKGNVALSWQPIRGEGSRGKAVLKLKKKPPPQLKPLVQIGQQIGYGVSEDDATWDGVIDISVSSEEFEPAEIEFRPATGEAHIENLGQPRTGQAPDWSAARPAVQIGGEQLSVRIHGDTVYDRATGKALWSNPALVTEQLVSNGDGRRGHLEPFSAVRAVVHDRLVVDHNGNHDGSPAVQVFDLRTGRLLWEDSTGIWNALFFLTDGRYVVDVDRQAGGSVVATDLATGEEAWRISPPDHPWSVTNLDGDLLTLGATTITRHTAA